MSLSLREESLGEESLVRSLLRGARETPVRSGAAGPVTTFCPVNMFCPPTIPRGNVMEIDREIDTYVGIRVSHRHTDGDQNKDFWALGCDFFEVI